MTSRLFVLVAMAPAGVSAEPGGDGARLAWAQRAGGPGTDYGAAVAVDGAGNAYVTGTFRRRVVFGEGADAVTLTTARGEDDVFLAKYGPRGRLRWAKRIGGLGGHSGTGVAVDASGDVYVTGQYGGRAVFGEGSNRVTIAGGGLFLAKYAPSGALRWAKGASGTSRGVTVDGAGNAYITGRFTGTAVFGEGGAQVTLPGEGATDVFVAKYGPGGAFQWARRAGGAEPD